MSKVIFVTCLVLFASNLFAANPADLTSTSRLCPVHYYKYVRDGDGSWYLLAIEPSKDRKSSILLFNWNSEDNTESLYEISWARQLSPNIQVGLIGDLVNPGSEKLLTGMVDFNRGNLSLGVIIPFEADGKLRIGPRFGFANLTAYATLTDDSKPLLGISYHHNGCIDLTQGGGTWWFRASKAVGKVTFELRTKFTKDDSFVGFGVAYCHD